MEQYGNNNDNNNNKPTYADAGRKDRVEIYGRAADTWWHQHCLETNQRYEPLADDRLSTREACKQADCLTDGVPTELTIWRGWDNDGDFPMPRVQILEQKIWMRDAYPEGSYIMMNKLGTRAIKIPFNLPWAQRVESPTMTGRQIAYRFDVDKCEQFELRKVRTDLN